MSAPQGSACGVSSPPAPLPLRAAASASGSGVPGSPSSGGPGRVLRAQGWPRCHCPYCSLPHLCWCTWLACGLRGWVGEAATSQGHLPCSLWPRCLLGVLGVPDGQHLPRKVWRDQPPIPETLATGQEPAARGWARVAAREAHQTRGPSTGLPSWEGLSSCSSRGLGSQQGGCGTATAPESLAEGPRTALEDGGFMAGAPWAPQSCLTEHTVLSWPHTGIFGQGTRSPQAGAPLRQGVPRPPTPEGHSAGTGPLCVASWLAGPRTPPEPGTALEGPSPWPSAYLDALVPLLPRAAGFPCVSVGALQDRVTGLSQAAAQSCAGLSWGPMSRSPVDRVLRWVWASRTHCQDAQEHRPSLPQKPREYFLIMRPQLWLNPGWGQGTGRKEASEGATPSGSLLPHCSSRGWPPPCPATPCQDPASPGARAGLTRLPGSPLQPGGPMRPSLPWRRRGGQKVGQGRAPTGECAGTVPSVSFPAGTQLGVQGLDGTAASLQVAGQVPGMWLDHELPPASPPRPDLGFWSPGWRPRELVLRSECPRWLLSVLRPWLGDSGGRPATGCGQWPGAPKAPGKDPRVSGRLCSLLCQKRCAPGLGRGPRCPLPSVHRSRSCRPGREPPAGRGVIVKPWGGGKVGCPAPRPGRPAHLPPVGSKFTLCRRKGRPVSLESHRCHCLWGPGPPQTEQEARRTPERAPLRDARCGAPIGATMR